MSPAAFIAHSIGAVLPAPIEMVFSPTVKATTPTFWVSKGTFASLEISHRGLYCLSLGVALTITIVLVAPRPAIKQ